MSGEACNFAHMNNKLDIGSVFERIFATYGKQFGVLVGVALVIFIPVAIVNGLVQSGDTTWWGALLSVVIGFIGTYWYQGTVVLAADDWLEDGKRDHSIGSLLSASAPFIPALIAVGILAGIAIAIGLVLIIIPGLFLITIWAVLSPVIVLEKSSVFGSFGRSMELTKGNRWRVFGVLVLLFIITAIIGGIVSAIFREIIDGFAGVAIGSLIVQVFLAPLSALAAAILYFGLKQAHEGGGALPATDAPLGGPESPAPIPSTPPPPVEPGGPPPQAPPPQ
jgi:hypothetical protein